MFLFRQLRVKSVTDTIMKYFMFARRKFVMFRTRIFDAVTAVIDLCFFRRRLKWRISTLTDELSQMRVSAQNNLLIFDAELQQKEKDNQLLRAQLARLRVAQESVRDRTGFMVGAFIPDGVLTKLRSAPDAEREEFRDRVLKNLLSSALSGVFRVNSRGNLTALVFEPLGLASDKRIVTPIFESTKDGKPVFSAVVSPDLSLIEKDRRKWLTDCLDRLQ